MFRVDGFFVFVSISRSFLQRMQGTGTEFGVEVMWCVLFGGGGEDVLIPIEVYSVYIRGPPYKNLEMEQIVQVCLVFCVSLASA
jgi:hypothetical protein